LIAVRDHYSRINYTVDAVTVANGPDQAGAVAHTDVITFQ